MKKVYVVTSLYDGIVAIFSNRASAENFVVEDICSTIENPEEFFAELNIEGVHSAHDYCEHYNWDNSYLPYGISECEVKG